MLVAPHILLPLYSTSLAVRSQAERARSFESYVTHIYRPMEAASKDDDAPELPGSAIVGPS